MQECSTSSLLYENQLGTVHNTACLLFPFPHTVLNVEENRQWEKSHAVRPQPILAGWLRPEAAVVCKGPQTQINPAVSRSSPGSPLLLLWP